VSDIRRITRNPKRIELERLLTEIKENAERYRLEHGNQEFAGKWIRNKRGVRVPLSRKAYD
jgi:hypothetical protein